MRGDPRAGAPPLVLLPGMNCTADLWTGCGLDDALTPALTEDSMDAQVDRLLNTLPRAFVLGGLSLGAIVAMALAVRAPERVRGLIVASTNAKAPTPAQQDGWRAWTARLDAGASPRELQEGILPALLSTAGAARAELVERTLRMGEHTGPATLRAQLRMQATRTDLRAGLGWLRVPALVVAGSEDAICPPAFHAEIAAALPSARTVTIEAGHLLPLEQPAAFGELVRDWRSRLP